MSSPSSPLSDPSDDAAGDRSVQRTPEHSVREEQQALRTMYRITANQSSSFEEKTEQLIALGRDYLELPYGHLTRIQEGTQEIIEADGGHPQIQPGATCPLAEAYCRKTIAEGGFLAIQNAPAEGWADDPAYEQFGLKAYIGAKVRIGEHLYGTLCFGAHEAREQAFTEGEKTLLELMTRWLSYELERQRATERLRAQNQQLDRFAGVVSHDLRNPLNVAKGRLELAREEVESPHLSAVDRSLDRMDELIQDLLTLTWGQQEIGEEDLEACALDAVAEECWAQVARSSGTLQRGETRVLRADKGRLRRLLENLFRNALEHGGDDVTVRVGALDEGFFVADDGVGIPPEKRDEVLKAGRSTNEEGTGLGLSIVQAVAQAHEWTLAVASSWADGARFEFRGVAGGDSSAASD